MFCLIISDSMTQYVNDQILSSMLDLVQGASSSLTKVFTITSPWPDVPVQQFIAEFKCFLEFSRDFDPRFMSGFVTLASVTHPVTRIVTRILVTGDWRDSVVTTLRDGDLLEENSGF